MPNLVGIGNSQVPTNAMLGGLAYKDSVGEIDIDKEFKIAAGMAVNNQIGVLNGTAIAAADTSCLMPTGVDRLYFGLRGNEGNQGSLTIKRFMFYPRRLPDSQLVTLTS